MKIMEAVHEIYTKQALLNLFLASIFKMITGFLLLLLNVHTLFSIFWPPSTISPTPAPIFGNHQSVLFTFKALER